MAAAPCSPPTSSSCPKATRTVRRGRKPSRASRSSASMVATTPVLSSSVPRPHTKPSAITPAKGGSVHDSGSGTGTTSRCDVSSTGASEASLPFHV